MLKKYVVDTNVLLNDPQAVLKFEENDVCIPLTVLEELDHQKSSDRDIARDARAAIRQLDELIGSKDPINEGVDLPTGGKLYILQTLKKEEEQFIEPTCNDDHIINNTFRLQDNFGDQVVLVSNDVCMRLKAIGVGVKNVQEFNSDIIVEDPDLLPQGYVELPPKWLESLPKDSVVAKSCGETHILAECVADLLEEVEQDIGINDWLLNEEEGIAARLEGQSDCEEYAIFTFHNVDSLMRRNAAGIRPKDLLQAITLDAILDQEVDIVIIDGAAGTGKTLMAMAGGTEIVKGKKKSYRMQEIVFSRSNDTQFKEIGYLKGGEAEKMAPWLEACNDNMKIIARDSKNKKFSPEHSVCMSPDNEDAFIFFKNLGFMRGRSINHTYLVIDEFQNLTPSQAKTVLSRAGEFCKVIIMGNLGQIDNDYISPRSSGLTYATEKFHGQPFAKVVRLGEVQRSRVAAFVEENF